jgi:hypothetical protein
LKAKPGVKGFRRFGKGRGAYVHIAAWADSKQEFEEQVKVQVDGLDCVLLELEEIQSLDHKINGPNCLDELITMRETAIRQPLDTVFGTFHIWDQSDAN